MARQPVTFEGGYEPLRPIASPVDTFVAPARSPLRDLADSLRSATPELEEFFSREAAQRAKEDDIRGKAAFYDENSEGLAEAIRTGKVPSQYSPAFVRGYKESMGASLGNKMLLDFNSAFDAWENKGQASDEDFGRFLDGFVSANLDTDDPDVLKALHPRLQALTDYGFEKWQEYRHATTYKGALESSIAEASQAVDIESASGITTEMGTDYPRLFKTILDKRTAWVARGMEGAEWDKVWVDAIANKVIQTRDPQLLTFFDQLVPGTGYKYGDTAYGAKIKQDTKEQLEVIFRRETTDEAAAQVRKDKLEEDALTSAVIDSLLKDPAGPVPEPLLKRLTKFNGKARVNAEEWRRSLGQGFSDPEKLKDVYREIMNGRGEKAVRNALNAGIFGRPEDLSAALSFAKSVTDNEDRIEDALKSRTVTSALETFKQRTSTAADIVNPNASWSDDGLLLRDDFERMVIEWIIQNPDASLMEREEALTGMRDLLLQHMGPNPENPMAAGGQTYTRPGVRADITDPQDRLEANRTAGSRPTAPVQGERPAEVDTAKPIQGSPIKSQPVDPSKPPAGKVTLMTPDMDDVRLWLDDLTPEQRSVVDEAAFSHGITTFDYVNRFVLGQADPTVGAGGEVQPADGTPITPEPSAKPPEVRSEGEPQPWLTIPRLGIKIGPWRGFGASDSQPNRGQEGTVTEGSGDQRSDAMPDPLPIEKAAYQPGSGGRSFAAKGMAALAPNGLLPEKPQDGGLVPSSKRGYTPDLDNLRPALKRGVEGLQASFGDTLPIVSGYRSRARNTAAGGAKRSEHTHGNAVDIDVSGMSREKQLRLIQMASEQGFTGIGVYGGSIHLDYGGRRAWGPSHGRESVPSWAEAAVAKHLAGRSRLAPGDAPKLPGLTPEIAMAFLDEALEVQPYDTGYEGSSRLIGHDGEEDQQASRIANLIYAAEAGGNYNALFGNPGSALDLSKLTLDQLIVRQWAAKQAGAGSTAVGAGQFLMATLIGLKRELGLSGSENFTPQLQDRLTLTLLNRRGYQAYKEGRISKRRFAFNLAQEWAGLPRPDTGGSHYAGVGSNRATVTRGQVYAALGL